MCNHTSKPSFLETDFPGKDLWSVQLLSILSIADDYLPEFAPFRQSLQPPHQHPTVPTRQVHHSVVSTLVAHHVLLPAQCSVLLRWHNSNLILPAFTECAVIVPDARDKIWKIRVHKYEREDGEFRVKRNRVLYSHPWFSKEKIGPWRLSDSLKAIPQPYLQYILLFTRIKNNSFQCPQLPKVVCHPRYYLSY